MNSAKFDGLYVKSKSNPANLLTKIPKDSDLNNDLWWHGPSFLRARQEFPSCEPEDKPEEEFVLSSPKGKEQNSISTPFDLKIWNFSSLSRLLNVTRYCLKFIKKTEIEPKDFWISKLQ